MGVKTRGRGTSASFWGPGSAAAGRRRCSQGPKSQLGPRRWFKKYLNIRKNARVRAEARKLRSKLNYLASNWVSGAQDRQHWARGAAPWPAVWYSCASCGIPALLVAYLCFLWCCCASRGILVLLVVPLCFLWYPCAPCGILWPAVVFVVFRGRLRDPVVFCGPPLCPVSTNQAINAGQRSRWRVRGHLPASTNQAINAGQRNRWRVRSP